MGPKGTPAMVRDVRVCAEEVALTATVVTSQCGVCTWQC